MNNKEKNQVYFFCKYSSASKYGMGTYLQQLLDYFKVNDNIFFNVIYYNTIDKEFSEKVVDNIHFFKFPHINNKENEKLTIRNIWYILQTFITQKDEKLIFHLNSYSEHYLVPLIRQVYPHSKIVFTIHYQDWGLLLQGNTSYFRKIIHNAHTSQFINKEEKNIFNLYKRDKKLFEDVDYIISLCDYTRNILVEDFLIPNNKIFLIPNGIKDEGIVLSLSEKRNRKIRRGIPVNEKIILYVGRLENIKGFDELILAYQLLLEEHNRCRLIVVGTGDFTKYLKKAGDSRYKMSFTGMLDKKELYELYTIADLGVVPSKSDQFNYVAVEMMMFNIPLIISTSSGLNERSKNATKLEVIETNDTVAISPENLKTLMYDNLIYKSRNQNMRKEYLKKYTLNIFYKKMSDLYNKIVSTAKNN